MANGNIVVPLDQSPNQFHVSGCGISVSYYPGGAGPVDPQRGRVTLVYQDSTAVKSFYSADVRVVHDTDVGTLVSVTTATSIDVGATTFTVTIPRVALPAGLPSQPVVIRGIQTVHRILAGALGHPQLDTYSIDCQLTGSASIGDLPD